MIIFNENLLSQIERLVLSSDFAFRETDYPTIHFPSIDIKIHSLAYIMSEMYNKITPMKKLYLKKIHIKSDLFNDLYKDVYKKICNSGLYNFRKFIEESIRNNLHLELPNNLILESNSQLESQGKFKWIFKLNTYAKIPSLSKLANKIIKFIFEKIYDRIVISFTSVKFIVFGKYMDENFHRECIQILSYNSVSDNLNQISFYCSNSEMGLMRFMSKYRKSDGSEMLAKYLDYATETLIDFRLQQQINNKIVDLGTNGILCNLNKFNILEWTDPINLNLLKIERTGTNSFIEKRGYLSPLLYCFSTTKCGDVFVDNYHNKIQFVKEIMAELVNIINKSDPNNKHSYNHLTNIHYAEDIYTLDNIILFINVEESINKILKLFNFANEALSIVNNIVDSNKPNYKTTEYLTIHYTMLGKMLNEIIDEIIGIDSNIFQYEYDLDGVDEKKYKFIVSVNRLKVTIDSTVYNIYYSKYNVKFCTGLTNGDFNPDFPVYKSILKIVKTIKDNVIESGVANCFIIAGSLQCKPIEYIEQLTAVLDLPPKPSKSDSKYKEKKRKYIRYLESKQLEDKNYLNSTYYFIGEYVNVIFEYFDKFNDYERANGLI